MSFSALTMGAVFAIHISTDRKKEMYIIQGVTKINVNTPREDRQLMKNVSFPDTGILMNFGNIGTWGQFFVCHSYTIATPKQD